MVEKGVAEKPFTWIDQRFRHFTAESEFGVLNPPLCLVDMGWA